MHYNELFSRSDLYQAVTEGLVRINMHDELPLGVVTYSEKAQFDNIWTPVTINCRGLVIDFETGLIVGLTLPKFFNSNQHGPDNPWAPALPNLPFEVFEKVDGSLITVFHYAGRWMTASKGSFNSDQAKWAQARVNHRQYAFREGLTYIAEAVYPENRIVVDYKGQEDLVLLAARDNFDGAELPLSVVENSWRGVGSVVTTWGLSDPEGLPTLTRLAGEGKSWLGKKQSGTEAEGYVIRFTNGVRAKVKLADYLEAHKLFTNTNERTVWGWLATGQDVSGLLSFVPDEYAVWAREVASGLLADHAELICMVEESYLEIMAVLPSDHTRKDFAQLAVKYKWAAALFARYDGAGFKLSEWAWKQLCPKLTGGSTVIRVN